MCVVQLEQLKAKLQERLEGSKKGFKKRNRGSGPAATEAEAAKAEAGQGAMQQIEVSHAANCGPAAAALEAGPAEVPEAAKAEAAESGQEGAQPQTEVCDAATDAGEVAAPEAA